MENNTTRRGAGLKGEKHGRDEMGEDCEGLTFSFLERLAGGVKGAFIVVVIQVRPGSCQDHYGHGNSRAQGSPR